MNARTADAIVVGAGIVGAACAEALAADGMRVAVLESEFPGAGATAAGMGHLVAMDDSEAQLALTAYSNRLWKERAPTLPPACELDPCGTLWIAEDAAERLALEEKRERYARHGIASEVVAPDALSRFEPNLRAGLGGALRVPGDSVLYPPAAARASWRSRWGRSRSSRVRVPSVTNRGVTNRGVTNRGVSGDPTPSSSGAHSTWSQWAWVCTAATAGRGSMAAVARSSSG